MKIYLISQTENNDYDTYDSAVVCAPDEETAQKMSPADGSVMTPDNWINYTWCESQEQVNVKYLGETELEQGLILSSFNAG